MPFIVIQPEQGSCIIETLNNQAAMFIIPSFQRPYVWGIKEIDDLRHDMKAAAAGHGYHYLSALHLLSLNNGDHEHLDQFVQPANSIIKDALQNGQLHAATGGLINRYAVVDGQQRLTTLFLIAHKYYAKQQFIDPQENYRRNLEVRVINNNQLYSFPKLIQYPLADHLFMMQIVDRIWNPTAPIVAPATQAQKRLLAAYKNIEQWGNNEINFIAAPNFRTMIIALQPYYGLLSFMTLNDRGRQLTVLEKFKAFLLQHAYDAAQSGATNLTARILSVFSDMYAAQDCCVRTKLFTERQEDDQLMRLISCYIRLDHDADAILQGSDAAYEKYFRPKVTNILADNTQPLAARHQAVVSKINDWCDYFQQLNQQLLQVGQNLQYSLEYQIPLLALGLSPHVLALLLKFRARFDCELHDRFPITAPVLGIALTNIHTLLNNIKGRAEAIQPSLPQPLFDYIDALLKQQVAPKTTVSMLEAVEHMQLLYWNRGGAAYVGFTNNVAATLTLPNPDAFVEFWFGWRAEMWLVDAILKANNDRALPFILREYERYLSNNVNNLHFHPPLAVTSDTIEQEHIFAQNLDANLLERYGFANANDYRDTIVLRSGNMTLLSKACNTNLGNEPPEVKSVHYTDCHGHPVNEPTPQNVASAISITNKVGVEMSALKSNRLAIRFYIEARCAELAIFVLRRFC